MTLAEVNQVLSGYRHAMAAHEPVAQVPVTVAAPEPLTLSRNSMLAPTGCVRLEAGSGKCYDVPLELVSLAG